MTDTAYRQLADRLDALPNGFPPTENGAELRILELLYTPEEAALAAQLRLTKESPQQIAARLGEDPRELRKTLKAMTRRGLIAAGPIEGVRGLGYGLLPFVVGIYEFQVNSIDAELAQLFEDYFMASFGQDLAVAPQVHRVIPIGETVQNDMEVHPYESASAIVQGAKSWGVVPCICRTQKALIGEACDHPIDVCMILGPVAGAFDNTSEVRALSREEAFDTLQLSADAGLVHSVSNSQDGLTYICNCCTCSCGILRGMADLGMANVVARSAFVNTVDEDLCTSCENCIEYCQFDALELNDDGFMAVNEKRCVGCGVCVPQCSTAAMVLVRRPEAEIKPVPPTHDAWLAERASARGIDMGKVL